MRKLAVALAFLIWSSCAQSQGIIPNGQTVFLGSNGTPLSGGQVFFYVPGTTTPKTTWVDSGLTVSNPNPVLLDANGQARIWGTGGLYREVVLDSLGQTVWDQVTSVPAASQNTLGGNVVYGPSAPATVNGNLTCFSSTTGGNIRACNQGSWTTYVPVVTCSSGAATPTNYALTGEYYKLDRQVTVNINLAIVTNGTCGTAWTFTLPFQVGSFGHALIGNGNNGTGQAETCYADAAGIGVVCKRYDGAYPGADLTRHYISGTYEASS